MFKNYLKIAIRNIFKEKLYSFINIIGLSLGITACILLFLFIQSELTFDGFHKNKDNIYRVVNVDYDRDGSIDGIDAYTPVPFAPQAAEDIAGIDKFVRFQSNEMYVKSEKLNTEEQVQFIDRSFFDVFTFNLKYGNKNSALDDPKAILITESMVNKFFDEPAPIGEQLFLFIGGEYIPLTVKGVIEDAPENSTVQYEIIVPYDLLQFDPGMKDRWNEWFSFNSQTFLLLDENVNSDDVISSFKDLVQKIYGEEIERMRSAGRWEQDFAPIEFGLQPIEDIHHNMEVNAYGGIGTPADPENIFILGGIALAILFIACFNFMNLSLGRSVKRSKEVAIRKVIGADRKQLMKQFWGEAILFSTFALFAGIGLTELFLPGFNQFIGRELSLNLFESHITILSLAGITLLTGFLAGSYPALILSGFSPVRIFSKSFKFGGSNLFTRVLIVAQFSIAVFLIFSLFIMQGQVDYMKNKYLGFDKEHLIVVPANQEGIDANRLTNLFKNELGDRNEFVNLSAVSNIFGRGYHRVGYRTSDNETRTTYEFRVDPDFVKTMGMNIVRGRDFDPALISDSVNSVLINETLAEKFGLENPVGQKLDGFARGRLENPTIVGVIKDFNFLSLENENDAVTFHLSPDEEVRYMVARVNPQFTSQAIGLLNDTWSKYENKVPFQYFFLDDDLNKRYEDVEQWASIVSFGGGISIFLSALGLLGMVALSIARRYKEIGIRKVLGATMGNIISIFSKEFILLVAVANIIAWPLAYFAMREWLIDFANRIDIGYQAFLYSALIAIGIAFITLSIQTLSAAASNPVNSIRDE